MENKPILMTTMLRTKVLATIALVLLGLFGNYLNLPLFFSVNFIFGSIAVMLAIVLLGTVPALLVALVAGAYTIFLWGHPYALVVFVLEALVVGYLYKRGWRNLVLSDLVFWLVLGAPLVLALYRGVLGMPWEAATLIALKQPVNGLFNALFAGLVIIGWRMLRRDVSGQYMTASQLSGLLFHVVLMVVILAGTVPILHEGHSKRNFHEQVMAERLGEGVDEFILHLKAEQVQTAEQAKLYLSLNKESMVPWSGMALITTDGEVLASLGDVVEAMATPGEVRPLENGLSQWLPTGDMPAMQRWKAGRYRVVKEVSGIGQIAYVVIEKSSAPLVAKVERDSATQFGYLVILVVFGLIVARALSHWLTVPLTRLSRIASETNDGVVVTDREGRVEWVNEAFTRISGYTLNELKGRKPGDVLQGEETSAAAISMMNNALSQQAPFNVDVVNYSKTGQPYWVRISCNPMRDESGSLTGYMAIESDIDEQKRAEKRLRESELRFRSIFDDAGDAIYIHDRFGRIMDVNQGACDQTGYTRAELISLNVSQLDRGVSPDALLNIWERAQGQANVFPMTLDSIHRCKDGREFPIEVRISMLTKDENNLFIAVVRDITERKRMDRMKREFVSTVSHELRTPLTSISGALSLVASDALGELPAKAKEMLSIAQSNSQRLTELINDLLDMEKIAAGKMHFEMQPHSLDEVVKQGVDANQSYGLGKGVTISLAGHSNAEVRVDRQRLLQVMYNLLSNAIKFSPESGCVEVVIARRDGHVRVSVQDHGPGIPEEFRARIFQKFAQADSSDTRQKGGTGLGLAISRELVERMGGVIGFDSLQGKGADFYFEFPIWRGEGA